MFQMPQEKIDACRLIFDLFDTDKSGAIDSNELAKIMEVLGIQCTDKEIEEMLKFLDEDKNGKIEFDEFLKIFEKKLLEPDTYNDLYDSFRIIDYSCKGTLSKEEIENVMLSCGDRMSIEEVRDFLSYAPQNEKGEIDYKEFAQILSEKISPNESSVMKQNDPLSALTDLNDEELFDENEYNNVQK